METREGNHTGLFLFSVPHVLLDIGIHLPVISEPGVGDRLAVENGEVSLLMDHILLPVAGEEVLGGHQGKGGIRVFGPELVGQIASGVEQLAHAGDGAEDSTLFHLQRPMVRRGLPVAVVVSISISPCNAN